MNQLKDDLIYKGVSHPFCVPVTLKEGAKCTPEAVLQTILSQNPDCNLLKEKIEKIKSPLNKLLDKIDSVRNNFYKIVNETAQSRESGKTIGWALKLQLMKLIPKDLVGGKPNKDSLLENFRKSLLFGKEDLVPDSLLMNGIVIKQVLWLKTLPSSRQKLQIMTALVKWLWRLAKRIVASCFYVSEIQGAPNQLTYIPQRLWKSETDKKFNSFSHLRPLSVVEAQKFATIRHPATLRWMPKSKGLRPILTVRGDKRSALTISAKKLILSLVEKHHSKVNAKYIHSIWGKTVKLQEEGQKLYFVACDINDAFGSISQDKLIEILEEEVMRQLGSKGFSGSYKEIAFIKKVIKCQTIKTSKRSYHLSKGLAQGMPLSGPLCNLYLSHLDHHSLAGFTCEPGDNLIRAVDDYLYITTDRNKAQRFLDTMISGLAEYGMQVNPTKTKTNLEGDLEILYNGFLFNTSNCEIYITIKGDTISIRNSMVFKNAPIELLGEKLKINLHHKLNELTLNRRYMTEKGVARNVLHTGCVLACKFMAILALSCPADIPYSGCLVDLIISCAASVAQRVCKVGTLLAKDAKKMNAAKEKVFNYLNMEEIKWVVLRAFEMILTQAANMNKNLPHAVLPLVSETLEAAEAKVRWQIKVLLTPVVSSLPPLFRNWDTY